LVGRSVGAPIGRVKSHTRGRLTFIVLISVCWLVGLFGIEGARLSSFQVPLIAGAGFLVYGLIGLLRRHEEPLRRDSVEPSVLPRTCVVVRQFGDASREASMRDHPAWQRAVPVDAPPDMARVIEFKRREGVLAGERVRQRRVRPRPRRADYIPLTGI
jgi:hypothetical protein